MSNFTNDSYELLLKYLDGEMNAEEQGAFEVKLAADPGLQQQLTELRISREAIRQYGLRRQVADIHTKMMGEIGPAAKVISIQRRWIHMAGSIAAGMVLILAAYIVFNKSNPDPEKMYTSRYQAFELSTTRGVDSSQSGIEKAYRRGDFNEVDQLYNPSKDTGTRSRFLVAMARMNTGNMTGAISLLESILNSNRADPKPLFNDETEYFLLLAYIRQKEFAPALELIDKILADHSHLYHEKVTAKMRKQLQQLHSK